MAWSPDSRAVAFFADGKLKTVPIEGGPARDVCDARLEGSPAWNGQTILHAQYSTQPPAIYRVDSNGGKPEPLDLDKTTQPWSPYFLPDGKRFLYTTVVQPREKRELTHELWIGSLDGRPAQRITTAIDSHVAFANGDLLFVRDGTLLAQPFDPDKGRFTAEARKVIDELHYFRSTGLAAFSVSANGVLAWRTAQQPSRLAWFDRGGIEIRQIARGTFHPDGRMSPDGRRYAIGVVDPKQATADIHLLDTENPEQTRPFVVTPFVETSPRFSPDGRWVAFQSDLSGRPEIYVRPLAGSAAAARISRDGGSRPRCRHDGKELYFLGAQGRVMSVEINAGVANAAPKILFQTADAIDFQPALDGSRFPMHLEENADAPDYTC